MRKLRTSRKSLKKKKLSVVTGLIVNPLAIKLNHSEEVVKESNKGPCDRVPVPVID